MRKLLLILLTVTFYTYAQTEAFNPEDYRTIDITAIKIENPLNIDGLLDEPLYLTNAYNVLLQVEPNNGELGSEVTEYWIGYDDNAIYVGARMYDSQPDSIVARLGRRDTGWDSNDQFGVVIDSYHDKRSGFFFVLNPAGTIFDGTLENDSRFSTNWDGIWDGKTKIDENGWTAEMKIPFSQLRFNESLENIMGIEIVRIIFRKQERTLNHYLPRDESGIASHFPTLKGIKNIKPPKRLEATPYVTGNYELLKSKEDNPFYNGRDSNINIGTDLKIGIGNNLTIDATINPDFGQVEVDPSVINLSAYETFFQEKRPFFIEGAGIFRFGEGGPTNQMGFNFRKPTFFYSRRIGSYPSKDPDGDWVKIPSATSILGATKLSGKMGNVSVGVLSAMTKREYAKVLDGDIKSNVEVEPLTSYNMVRVQKEFNKGNQGLGLIGSYVHRDFDDKELRNYLTDNASTFGLDGWTFLNEDKDWVVSSWVGFSEVNGSKIRLLDLQESSSRYYNRPDAEHVKIDSNLTKMCGYSGQIILNKETGNVNFYSSFGIISPGFEVNDLGLNFSADRINKTISGGYSWLEPGDIFRFASINTAYSSNHNFEGIKVDEMLFFLGHFQFANYWGSNFILGIGPRTMSDTKLRSGPLVIDPAGMFMHGGIRSDSRKDLQYDLDLSYSSAEKGTYSYSVNPSVGLNIGSRLRLDIEPDYQFQRVIDQYIDSFNDETAVDMLGCRHFVAQMDRETVSAELRIDYTFTPKLSFQAYIQPYMTVGSYSRFKEFAKPETYDFVEYGKDNNTEIIEDGEDGYELYPNGSSGNSFYISNPDFNYKALVGSAVLRWEFRPGSTLYLVWTRNGSDEKNPGDFALYRDLGNMLSADADNVFALKVTYWLGK